MMKNIKEVFRFLSAFRIFVAIIGFLLGILIFFELSSLKQVLGAGLVLSLTFFTALVMVQSAWKKNWRALSYSAAVLVIIMFLILLVLYTSVSGGAAITTVKYNPFQGECEKVAYGSFDGAPWYYSSCQGEKLQNYCSERVDGRNSSQFQACLKNKGLPPSSDFESRLESNR